MKFCRNALILILCAVSLLSQPALAGGGADGEVRPKYLALTFDDGPTGKVTEQLLDGLRQRGIRATFFLCGYRIQEFPGVVQTMAADGHELAIHGQSHCYLHSQSPAVIRRELEETGCLVEELTGRRPRLFRPPGGLISEALREEAAREDLSIILWSVDPEDWSCSDVSCIARRVTTHVRDGDVILMHDLAKSSVSAALAVIDQLQAQGYRFRTVPELAALRGVELEPAGRYHRFPG